MFVCMGAICMQIRGRRPSTQWAPSGWWADSLGSPSLALRRGCRRPGPPTPLLPAKRARRRCHTAAPPAPCSRGGWHSFLFRLLNNRRSLVFSLLPSLHVCMCVLVYLMHFLWINVCMFFEWGMEVPLKRKVFPRGNVWFHHEGEKCSCRRKEIKGKVFRSGYRLASLLTCYHGMASPSSQLMNDPVFSRDINPISCKTLFAPIELSTAPSICLWCPSLC